MVNLRYITCSDPRPDTSIGDAINFLIHNPIAELAVQVHPTKVSPGSDRYAWFDQLIYCATLITKPVHLAMHVNLAWCHMMCLGHVPPALANWMDARHVDGRPVVGRIQINMAGSQTSLFDASAVANMIRHYGDQEFILQFTPMVDSWVQDLKRTGARFSVLYDASGGMGRAPAKIDPPFTDVIATGYSGGIGPDNVAKRLSKIKDVAVDAPIWIDAEGKLKNPETGKFDIDRAWDYVINASRWYANHQMGR